MCTTCGCSSDHDHDHDHHQDHHHHHDHDHDHDQHHIAPRRTVQLERDILAKNDALARSNRAWLAGRGVVALNLVSSPGAGKTTLLEHTIRALAGRLTVSVIEGDQETARDAERIRATGARALQINTGTGCHLDAHAVGHALEQLAPLAGSLVMVENVGNLVCPALFDLGERAKVVVLSVTEGDDKPLKYPHMFRASEVMVLSKIDLLPHVSFDVRRCIAYARVVRPDIRVFEVSSTTAAGMDEWCAWLLHETRSTPAAGTREHTRHSI
jgi:hydrogenase nickel incorporation protein HypB